MAAQAKLVDQSTCNISNKAKPGLHLSIIDRQKVTLAKDNSHDKTQVWRRVPSTKVPGAFAILNNHTNKAIKATGKNKPVELEKVPRFPDGTIDTNSMDKSLLWTQDDDSDDCPKTIRVVSDDDLVLDAAINPPPGASISIMTWSEHGGDNQLWKFATTFCATV